MRIRRGLSVVPGIVLLFVVVMSLVPAGASSANISRSYGSDEQIKNGSIVSLAPKQQDFVVSANTENGSRLIGIAVAASDSLLAVDPVNGAVQVATSGSANTLVSTLRGTINVGDQIAVSPFSGIGMKASPTDPYVIGVAQSAFSKDTGGAVQQEVTDKTGKKQSIAVGFTRINIAVSPGARSGGESLTGLQKIGKSLTGHTIPTVRLIGAMVVAVVTILTLITLIYSAIYSSIISIGRNPLARYAVFRTLSSVLIMVAVVAVIATIALYLLLH